MRQPLAAIAILSTLLAAFGLSTGCSSRKEPLKVATASPASDTPVLSEFQPLSGTPYLMATVGTTDERSEGLKSLENYKSGGQTRNLVFLDSGSLSSQRLFESNAYIIVHTDQYTQKIKGQSVVRWLVHQVIKADTNQDGQLNHNDSITLGISSPSGKDYVEVLDDVDQFFGQEMVSPGRLIAIYQKENAKGVSMIDLDKRSITASRPLINLSSQTK
ncbi:MAG TPA: hypothetical protein V6D19_12895 [Stenomitos sp.]